MNRSGAKDPTAEQAVGRVTKENRKIKRCPCVESIGTTAVYVTPGCRKPSMVKGTLVSSRSRCLKCLEAKR